MSSNQEEEHTSSGKDEEQQPLTSSFELSSVLPINGNSVPPQIDRCTTIKALDALLNQSLRPTPSDVYGYGPMLLSDIPKNIRENKDRGVVLGKFLLQSYHVSLLFFKDGAPQHIIPNYPQLIISYTQVLTRQDVVLY